MTLSTYDLFTEEENIIYQKIIGIIKSINECQEKNTEESKNKKDKLIEEKKSLQKELSCVIDRHSGTPRIVRLSSVINNAKYKDENGNINLPEAIDWWSLKPSRRIAEFESEESRSLGLKHLDITFDKIIVKWKSLDILKQLVLDGFNVPVLINNEIVIKHFRVMTASAGQLRTDKVQCISDEAWEKIQDRIQCGMDWDIINAKGGININKLMAYTALPCSATDEWDFDINKCIVIKDFEAPVTGRMKYITAEYTFEDGIRTVKINHCDGCGMMLPSVSKRNFMVRGPWLKGLLTSFDFIKFCIKNNCPPIINDVWGKTHNLVEEDIRIIFTESQLKLWKYYDDWEHYKRCFKECGCHLCRTNYEDPYINDTTICYQMLQTLTDFTDDEIQCFTKHEHDRIKNIAETKESMLKVLGAEPESESAFQKSLYLYNELLRDGYAHQTLKAIKKRMMLDAKSGVIRCKNKRLFAIPDMYAACQFWFLNQEEPEGLLKDGEVACKIYRNKDKIDVLRSPHLYMEHAVRKVVKDPSIYEWFNTNGVYTSCHDLISRILQFDCDGDQLNCIAEELLVSIAERNIKEFDVVPLFYDANKAPAKELSLEEMFNGLKRAHDFSGIGQVSNSLTKLWNKENPDRDAAAWLTMYNNLVIDAAKTGKVNSYKDKPDINRRINKAIGGPSGCMPFFFQFSKNGRKESKLKASKKKRYAKENLSTMNRICKAFSDIKNINFNLADVAPFNWQMLLTNNSIEYYKDAVELFCTLDDSNISSLIESKISEDAKEQSYIKGYDVIAEQITHELTQKYGNLSAVYPSIVKFLFAGDGYKSQNHKQMFWRVFGDIAFYSIANNVVYSRVCDKCNKRIPDWATSHECKIDMNGLFECCDCGKICRKTGHNQTRCEDCAKKRNEMMTLLRKQKQRKQGRDK